MENKTIIHKDRSGQLWFIGVYTNNFKDREGEIFSWDSHVEFAQWARDRGVQFPITVLHQPKFPHEIHLAQFLGLSAGIFTAKEFSDNYLKLYKPFAIAQTEMIIPSNGFLLVVGKILDNKKSVAELIMKSNVAWGMSHGFIPLEVDDNIINKYRTFEQTVLPNSIAANEITMFNIKEIEMNDFFKGLSDEEKDVLKQALEASPEDLEEATKTASEVLKKVIDSKQMDAEEEEEEKEEEEDTQKEKSYEELRTQLFSDLDVEGLQGGLKQIVDKLNSIDGRMTEFEGRLGHTERSDDEKIAAKLTGPLWNFFKQEDVETEDGNDDLIEKLKETAIDDEKGVVDKTKEKSQDNAIQVGFWDQLGLKT